MSIKAFVRNRYTCLLPPFPKKDVEPFFSFHPPGYRFVPAYRMGKWDGKVRLLRKGLVPTGLFYAMREEIEKELDTEFKVTRQYKKIDFKEKGIVSDRDFQNECVEAMIEAANRKGGGLILNATGTGKTFIGAMLFSRLIGSATFVVDELHLLNQARNELSAHLKEKVGKVGQSKFIPRRITVATVQTLDIHADDDNFEEWRKQQQIVLIDEIHTMINKRMMATLESLWPRATFGLTATLELQKKHVRLSSYALAGPVVFEYPLMKGQEEGFLSPSAVVQIDFPKYHTITKGMAGYQEEYAELITESKRRNRFICDLVEEARKRDKFTVVIVERREHLRLLARELRDREVPHRVASGLVKVDKREEDLQKFEHGRVRVMVATRVFKKGVNIKRLDVIIDARGAKSKNDAQQIHGRGVRLADGKYGLIYVDIGDTENRFEKGSKSRRRALKQLGIPFVRLKTCKSVEEVFDKGQKLLEKAVKRVENAQLKLFE